MKQIVRKRRQRLNRTDFNHVQERILRSYNRRQRTGRDERRMPKAKKKVSPKGFCCWRKYKHIWRREYRKANLIECMLAKQRKKTDLLLCPRYYRGNNPTLKKSGELVQWIRF